jgi:hypothetical protein
MTSFFGSYVVDLPPCKEHLQIRFLPNALVNGHKWQHNGSSANFVAEYFATFFPYNSNILRDGDEIDIRDEVRGAVSYIANELLENAVKFNNAEPGNPIVLKLMLYSDRILFIATNYVDPKRASKLETFIDEIATADPDQLYIDKLEHSAINGDDSESGLGILTIINDYQARIGWRLEPEQAADGSESTEPEAIVLTVMVNLPLPQPS